MFSCHAIRRIGCAADGRFSVGVMQVQPGHSSNPWSFVETNMAAPNERMDALKASPAYAKAEASYSNAFVNGAGRQKPGSDGFALWLLYDIFYAAHYRHPITEEVVAMADAHGLNRTSAKSARLKWGAYRGFCHHALGHIQKARAVKVRGGSIRLARNAGTVPPQSSAMHAQWRREEP
jgi:hypothetical protein